ncbi:MAG TPA: glycosyltransferase [Bryobacteraceae bacterium]|nr:glycosyltransferase [Bryobacteraceae bacterium]
MTVSLTLAVGLGLAFYLVKSRLNYLALPQLPHVPGDPPPNVVVIIPARDEERNIRRVVESFRDVPVVVMDDASSDRTAEIATAAGATVLPAPPLRVGLLGKPNACDAGARSTFSEWILFVDADTYYEPDFLHSLITYASREKLDLVSCFLKQECLTFAEHLLLPYSFALYFTGVNARAVNSLTAPDALANGQCMLFRRSVYQFMGGHASVASSVIEDVELAVKAKRHRVRQRVIRAENLGHARMYENLTAIWRGFEKNSFRFLRLNKGTGLQVILASILLTSYIPMLAFLIWSNEPVWAFGFALLPGVLLFPWYGNSLSILSPIAIYLFQLIALSGMLAAAHGRRAVWKGRRV